VGDPGVGAALAHPGANLVELGLQRSPCQTAPDTTNTGAEIDAASAPKTVAHCTVWPRLLYW
jgi:hypothetical protein